MSKYTTGELAKLCSVTVRTVQYYDTRGILVPSELSEGGRRLYSGNDLKRMRIICFLRGLGISISSISELMTEGMTRRASYPRSSPHRSARCAPSLMSGKKSSICLTMCAAS